jgi:flavin reductase (DIM6/NTAB) family NADH-FMN oxidoreductase RutF
VETHLTSILLSELEQRSRTALINSVSGFKSLNLIGTAGTDEKTNLAVFNSVCHLGTNPALMGFIVRPDSVERHTLENIEALKYYTINHVNAAIHRKAHQTAARYPRDESEFVATGLTAMYQGNFPAPYVKESSIRIGLKLRERVDISLNTTSLIVGEIIDLYFPSACWCEDGYLDIEKAGTIAGSSLDAYHRTAQIERLSYAKPGKELQAIALNYRGQAAG